MPRISMVAEEHESTSNMLARYKIAAQRLRPLETKRVEPLPEPTPEIIDLPKFLPSDAAIASAAQSMTTMADQVQHEVAAYFHLKRLGLMSGCRTARFVKARHIAMALIKRYTSLTMSQIGRRFGGRDHTTVLHAINKLIPLTDEIWARIPRPALVDQIAEIDQRTDLNGKPVVCSCTIG